MILTKVVATKKGGHVVECTLEEDAVIRADWAKNEALALKEKEDSETEDLEYKSALDKLSSTLTQSEKDVFLKRQGAM